MSEPPDSSSGQPPEPRRVISIEVPRATATSSRDVLARVPTPFFGSAGFLGRIAILGVAALVAFGVLGLRLWSLQVLDSTRLQHAAAVQSVRVVHLPASRGTVVDDKGRTLAATGGAYAVLADPAALGKTASSGLWQPSAYGTTLLTRVARLALASPSTLIDRIRTDVTQSPYTPAVILPDVSEPLFSYLSERASDYRGVTPAALPVRSYPQGSLGSAFLGLVGQLSTTEIDQKTYPWASAGELVGQSGVEAGYDRYLNGGFSLGRVEVDSQGRQLSAMHASGRSRDPATVQLTIDARLQRATEQALRDGIKDAHVAGYRDADAGAAVVMNPSNGAIYALASAPEVNQAAAADNPSYYERLLAAPPTNSPLLNRATQGLYPVGSTFKPIVAEAALSAGLISPTSTLACTGSLTVGGVVFHNVESWIDAELTLPQALEISCDTWFYQLGEDFFFRQQQGKLGIQYWAHLLGLGQPTGIDIPGESGGVVPTPSWLEKSYHQTWYEGDSVNLSIGQGYLDVTPLQLAVAYAAFANGGTVVRPHVGQAVISAKGDDKTLSFPPVRHVQLPDLAGIREGLFEAAHGAGGTSTGVFGNYPIPVDGKTGTAQTSSGSDDSWYASWAPANNPKVVVVVLIEHGGFGADAAAPATREIYNAFFHIDPKAS